ncbi:hypothetical protein EMIT053CA3_20344 [Pseudomonas donghuensis]
MGSIIRTPVEALSAWVIVFALLNQLSGLQCIRQAGKPCRLADLGLSTNIALQTRALP